MQDLIFYVAAKETLGKVRDYSNMRSSDAPLLTLGVAVCLRMRLFEDIEDSTPYPIASFDSITSWNWRMDADYDRRTACKLVADAEGISVHTVTDTIKSETMSFTEVVIPISNMNTRELAAWIDNEKIKTGLAGELVGYDNEGHAAFVLQIENFSVRNRLSGLNDEDEDDPIPVDQEIVTRPLAEQMIQAAVSASAATKQDKLTSGNAGTGISISNAGVISTENVPQSAVTGLSVSLASKQDKLTSGNAGAGISISDNGIISVRVDSIPQSSVVGLESALNNKQNSLSTGFWIEIDDDWISVERYHAIHGPYSRGSITLQAGEAYKIFATNSVVTLDAESIPNNTWGLDGYLEIFVANTGYVQTTSRVVLANALEPDAVNNCRVEFRDGLCTITMENTLAGYIVTLTAGTGEGSLPYALSVSSSEYVAFDATTNGQTLDLAGATTYAGEKHVVGNGYAETAISGGITCTSKTTFSNLTMLNVTNSGGTMTLGDTYIPSGSTVAVSGGGLAIEKVTGDGGVIDLGGTQLPQKTSANIKDCIITNGYGQYGGMVYLSGGMINASNCSFVGNVASAQGGFVYAYGSSFLTFDSCVISGNFTQQQRGGAIAFTGSGKLVMNDCVVTGNTAGNYNAGGIQTLAPTELNRCLVSGNIGSGAGKDLVVRGTTVTLTGSTVADIQMTSAGSLVLKERNTIEKVTSENSTLVGTVTLTSGAVLDLTGNTNATPINPGGGITFEGKNATIYPSAGSASAATVIGLSSCLTIGNEANMTINSSLYEITTMTLSNCTVSSIASSLKVWQFSGNASATRVMTFENCTFDSRDDSTGFAIGVVNGTVNIKNCTFLHAAQIMAQGSQQLTINMEGNIYINGLQGSVALSGTTVNIAANTYIDCSDCKSSYVMQGAITFGAGVKIKKYGTTEYVDLVPGGTAGTCYRIERDGTVRYSA